MRHRLDAIADEHGERCLRIVRDALRDDGVIDRNEAHGVVTSLIAWKRASRAARVSGSLASSLAVGIDIGPYFDRRVNDYRAAVDEMPDPKEAA